MKRTTLVLEEGLLAGIRREAQRRGCDMSRLVNDLLREGLHRRPDRPHPRVRLPVFSMGQARVNVADRDALEDLMRTP
ncbi:MAG: hypothetical protein KF833_06425 [Verrucomicrobiae bacterium]|nr:hypothetical protein [Verrucomicrobiae bacterium]